MRTQAHGNRFLNELKLKVEQGKKENLSYMCAGFEVVRSTKKEIGTHKECLSLFLVTRTGIEPMLQP